MYVRDRGVSVCVCVCVRVYVVSHREVCGTDTDPQQDSVLPSSVSSSADN